MSSSANFEVVGGNKCITCRQPMKKSMKLEPCNHIICDVCFKAVTTNPQCPHCGDEVDKSTVEDSGTTSSSSSMRCKLCGWTGMEAFAQSHECKAVGSAGAAGGGAAFAPSMAAPIQQELTGYTPPMDVSNAQMSHLFWDYDNLQPSLDTQFVKFYIALVTHLEKEGQVFSRHFLKTNLYVRSGGQNQLLTDSAQKLRIHVNLAGTKKEAADRLISKDIRELIKEVKDNPKSARVIIVSSDMDFAEDMRDCEQEEVETCVVHDAKKDSEHEAVLSFQAGKALSIRDCVPAEFLIKPAAGPGASIPGAGAPPPYAAATKVGVKTMMKRPQNLVSAAEVGQVVIEGRTYSLEEFVDNDGLQAYMDGRSSPHLCDIDTKHNINFCEMLHKKSAAQSPMKSGIPSMTTGGTPNKAIIKSPSTAQEKTNLVDGEEVPLVKVINNQAVKHLLEHPNHQGKKCTNKHPHNEADCGYIHFKKLPKTRRF